MLALPLCRVSKPCGAVRDRALFAIGMAAALCRSELIALQLADVALVPEGLRLTVSRPTIQ